VIKGEIANLETPYLVAAYLVEDTLEVDTVQVDKKGRFSSGPKSIRLPPFLSI